MKKSLENDPVRIERILSAAGLATALATGQTRGTVAANIQLRLALRYLVQVVGEAASQLTDQFKREHGHIPWSSVIGMRHRLVHGYHAVDLEVVWDTVKNSLPALVSELEAIMDEAKGE